MSGGEGERPATVKVDAVVKLRAVIDGEAQTFTAAEATELHARMWDMGAEIGRLKALLNRIEAKDVVDQLHREADKLVGQVLAEEQRRIAAENRIAELEQQLAAVVKP